MTQFHVPDFTFSAEEAARAEIERRNAEAYERTVGAAVKEAQERPIGEQITLKEYVRSAFIGQAQALATPEFEQQKRQISDQHHADKKSFYYAKFDYEEAVGRRQTPETVAKACAAMTAAQMRYAPDSVSPERKKAFERFQNAETDQQRLAAGQAMHRAVGSERDQEWNHHKSISNFQRQEAQMAGLQDRALGMANRVISEESRSRPGQREEDPQVHQASKSALDSWKEKLTADRKVERAYKEAGISSRHEIERAPIERQVDLMRAAHERFEKTQQFVGKARELANEKERAMTQPGMVAENVEPAQKNPAIREKAFKPEGSQTWHEKGTRLPLVRETANGVQAIGDSARRKECVSLGLDVLQERGAKSVNLKGSQEFRKEAWLQASERGMAAKGYEPTMEDRKELRTRMAQKNEQSRVPARSQEHDAGMAMCDAMEKLNNRANENARATQNQSQAREQRAVNER